MIIKTAPFLHAKNYARNRRRAEYMNCLRRARPQGVARDPLAIPARRAVICQNFSPQENSFATFLVTEK